MPASLFVPADSKLSEGRCNLWIILAPWHLPRGRCMTSAQSMNVGYFTPVFIEIRILPVCNTSAKRQAEPPSGKSCPLTFLAWTLPSLVLLGWASQHLGFHSDRVTWLFLCLSFLHSPPGTDNLRFLFLFHSDHIWG